MFEKFMSKNTDPSQLVVARSKALAVMMSMHVGRGVLYPHFIDFTRSCRAFTKGDEAVQSEDLGIVPFQALHTLLSYMMYIKMVTCLVSGVPRLFPRCPETPQNNRGAVT